MEASVTRIGCQLDRDVDPGEGGVEADAQDVNLGDLATVGE